MSKLQNFQKTYNKVETLSENRLSQVKGGKRSYGNTTSNVSVRTSGGGRGMISIDTHSSDGSSHYCIEW